MKALSVHLCFFLYSPEYRRIHYESFVRKTRIVSRDLLSSYAVHSEFQFFKQSVKTVLQAAGRLRRRCCSRTLMNPVWVAEFIPESSSLAYASSIQQGAFCCLSVLYAVSVVKSIILENTHANSAHFCLG